MRTREKIIKGHVCYSIGNALFVGMVFTLAFIFLEVQFNNGERLIHNSVSDVFATFGMFPIVGFGIIGLECLLDSKLNSKRFWHIKRSKK
jgi:hypothetical protein